MCCSRKSIGRCVPKKFLYKFPLATGARCAGVLMLFIMLAITLATTAQVIYINECTMCKSFAWRDCFGHSIVGLIYIVIMLLVNIWFLYKGVHKKHASTVLSWIILTLIWLVETFSLLLVLLIMYSADTIVVWWLISLIFGLIAFAIVMYFWCVVIGFWLEMKSSNARYDYS